jgi:protein-arginine deiminase
MRIRSELPRLLLAAFAPLAAGACDPGDDASPNADDAGDADEDEARGGYGKADAPGSCQPNDCGEQASIGQCWCDDQCASFGDCCVDKADVCDAGPATPSNQPTGSSGWTFDEIRGVPNLDDDDGQILDWEQYLFASDDDVSTLVLPASTMAMVGAEGRVELQLSGDVDLVRVWHDGEPAAGASAGGTVYRFTPGPGATQLPIEFGEYNVHATLTLRHLAQNDAVLASTTVALHSSPLILNHHLQPAEHVWAVAVNTPGYDNTGFIQAYQNALGSKFTSVSGASYGYDVWIQDEFEFGTSVGDEGQRLDVIIDSIRDRGLDPYPRDALVGPDIITDKWGSPWAATSFDSFGNLEASPPVVVGGTSFPFGRIYYGRRNGTGLNATLASFLASQEVQEPFEVDTRWLCVGHVDEFSSFVPDPTSPKGFKLLIADVPSAYDILEDLPAGISLPRYGFDHGYPTVGAMRTDNALRALNEDIQFDHLTPIRQQFMTELGLTEADVIRVPSLFEHLGGCGVAALIPGMVNLIVADAGGQTNLFVPDPFFRTDLSDQGDDPFIEAFAASMPPGLNLRFVDNWNVYHLGIGEVHCGTNVKRTPTVAWWTAASHLIGGL